MASYEHGFEDERFENAVSQNFHCPICMNVFKDPVMCQRNQHSFCFPCITRHLGNSQTCPSCMEELTLDTLRQAPRVLSECLSELNIRCDYFSRGCHQFVQLEKLESHVKDCGFAPVVCSNEGCLVEINKRDKIHHEAEVCKLRKVKCQSCAEMTTMMAHMSSRVDEMEGLKFTLAAVEDKLTKLEVMEEGLTVLKDKLDKMDELKQQVNRLKTLPAELRSIKSKQGEILKEIKRKPQGAMKEQPSIIIAGGGTKHSFRLRSSEIFNWFRRSWSQLQPMKECRSEASSFVYKNQIIVTGGLSASGRTSSMEQINIGPSLGHSTQWHYFPPKLPGKLSGHQAIVYNERLIVVGGHKDGSYSDGIHEVLMRPPYTSKLLARMPEPRALHGVELFNDKLFILGGKKAFNFEDSFDSVLLFCINNNRCQQITSLPVSVNDMATVKWGDNVILLGGEDQDGNRLNTVIIYNVNTGKSHMLPEMKYKRKGCSAVVNENTIVVMGGVDDKDNYLKTVECFTFERYSWEDLPSMNEGRFRPTAVSL